MLSDVSFSDTHIVKIVSKLSFLYIASQYIVAHILLRIPKRKIAIRFRVDLCLAMLLDCGLLILLFLVSFLCPIVRKIHTGNQSLATCQQDYQE